MIPAFGPDTALLLVDVQVGVDVLTHWGGATGRRNNPDAEEHLRRLLAGFRSHDRVVAWTLHDSREAASPLRAGTPGFALKPGFAAAPGEVVVTKDVNSAFVGTAMELQLRRLGISRLVVTGFFTNMCVETSVRMAGNLGFDTYLVPDCCSTTNRVGPDGVDRDPELVHDMTVANLHGEFCTAIGRDVAHQLLAGDVHDLQRVQGNE